MDGPRGRTGILLGSWPLGLPTNGRFYVDVARQVETAGYDLLFAGDHLFMYNPNPAPFAVLATFAYRLFSYWLPLPLGLGAYALHSRGGRSAARG